MEVGTVVFRRGPRDPVSFGGDSVEEVSMIRHGKLQSQNLRATVTAETTYLARVELDLME
jgi:hypothetical protein